MVCLPVDWTRGMKIEAGDLVTIVYNGSLQIQKVERAPDGEGSR